MNGHVLDTLFLEYQVGARRRRIVEIGKTVIDRLRLRIVLESMSVVNPIVITSWATLQTILYEKHPRTTSQKTLFKSACARADSTTVRELYQAPASMTKDVGFRATYRQRLQV